MDCWILFTAINATVFNISKALVLFQFANHLANEIITWPIYVKYFYIVVSVQSWTFFNGGSKLDRLLVNLHTGQIISEKNCGVLIFQKSNEIIVRISALASKMGQIKKNKGT